jgi:hypothetical protein
LAADDAIYRHQGQAPGVVTHVDHVRRGPDTTTVEFRTPDERVHTADIDESGVSVGDAVTVEYDTDDPSLARIKGSDEQFLFGLLGIPVGAGIVLYALISPSRKWRRT